MLRGVVTKVVFIPRAANSLAMSIACIMWPWAMKGKKSMWSWPLLLPMCLPRMITKTGEIEFTLAYIFQCCMRNSKFIIIILLSAKNFDLCSIYTVLNECNAMILSATRSWSILSTLTFFVILLLVQKIIECDWNHVFLWSSFLYVLPRWKTTGSKTSLRAPSSDIKKNEIQRIESYYSHGINVYMSFSTKQKIIIELNLVASKRQLPSRTP